MQPVMPSQLQAWPACSRRRPCESCHRGNASWWLHDHLTHMSRVVSWVKTSQVVCCWRSAGVEPASWRLVAGLGVR